MSIWSERIKELAPERGALSVLAKELDVPISTLSEIKAGRSKAPRYDLALRLLQKYEQLLAERQRAAPHESRAA